MNYLVHLRTFLDAYRMGSLTKAASHLDITQPAASTHLQALEAFVGKPLFVRQARGLTPTPAGDDLARSIAPHLDAIEGELTAMRIRSSTLAGTVHIAGPAEYLASCLGAAVVPLLENGIRIRFQTGNRDRIYALLNEGAVDLAITASRPTQSNMGFIELERERLLLVASQDLRESLKGRTVDAELLCSTPLLAYDEHLPLIRDFFELVFKKLPDMQAAITAPDLRILRSLLAAGAGWSVLPDYLCHQDLKSGRIAELPTIRPGPDNIIYLVWNKGALRHPRVAHVRDRLISHAQQGVVPTSLNQI